MLDSTYQPVLARPAPTQVNALGVALLSAFAGATGLLGMMYLILSITVVMLPNETEYLGMSASRLCAIDGCRLLDFMSHGRMSYSGALLGIGVMSGWLTLGPLKRGERWAWGTLLLAGILAYGSFLMFLVYGYLEWWHAIFVCFVSAVGITGLVLTRPQRRRRHRFAQFVSAAEMRASLRFPDVQGRLMIGILAAGVLSSGLSILAIAGSFVFVPQDTAFLHLTGSEIAAISEQVTPIMAHDRAGFGGGMGALGVMFAATAFFDLRSNARGAWRAVAISGAAFYAPTVAIHVAIEYTNVVHLLPVYAGMALLAIALFILWEPIHRTERSEIGREARQAPGRGGDPALKSIS